MGPILMVIIFVYKNRPVRSGGGAGLYVSDNLDYRILADIYADEDEVMGTIVHRDHSSP